MSDLNKNEIANALCTETEGVSRRQAVARIATVLVAGATGLPAPNALADELQCVGPVEFTETDKQMVDESMKHLRYLLESHNLSLKSVTAVVTPLDLAETGSAIDVRFAEESVVHVVMNMLAFEE